MKLNNSQRAAFVRSVLQDVPEVDYTEQAEKLVTAAVVSKLPPKVLAVWKDSNLRHYLSTTSVYLFTGSIPLPIHFSSYRDRNAGKFLTGEELSKYLELKAAYKKQEKAREDLRQKLRGSIHSCTTLKQAKEMMPDLVKYLPPDTPGLSRYVPAMYDVMQDLKAAGFPKEETASTVITEEEAG